MCFASVLFEDVDCKCGFVWESHNQQGMKTISGSIFTHTHILCFIFKPKSILILQIQSNSSQFTLIIICCRTSELSFSQTPSYSYVISNIHYKNYYLFSCLEFEENLSATVISSNFEVVWCRRKTILMAF